MNLLKGILYRKTDAENRMSSIRLSALYELSFCIGIPYYNFI